MLNDDAVVDYIIELVMEVQNRENTTLPILQEQLAETEKGLENMLNAIQAGVFTTSTKQRLDELEQTVFDKIEIQQKRTKSAAGRKRG